MTYEMIISLIKNYEEENKNYFSYMHKITNTLISNPAYILEIKIRLKCDLILKRRIIELGKTSNGQTLKRIFSNLFEEKGKIR